MIKSQNYIKFILGILLLIAVAYLAFWLSKPKPLKVQVARVQKGNYVDYIKEYGITRVRDKFVVSAPVTGKLKRISFKVGDEVKRNEVIAEIEWDWNWKVKSPVNGQLLKIYTESEGDVVKGAPLFEVGSVSDLEVVVDVLSKDAVNIKKDLNVKIQKWGGQVDLEGKVDRIEPVASSKISTLGVQEQRVNVVVEITSPKNLWSGLGDSYRVESVIILSQVESATIIPTTALFRIDEDWYVFLVKENKMSKQKVILESRNPEIAWIKEGLSLDEEIILFPSEKMKDGMQIRKE